MRHSNLKLAKGTNGNPQQELEQFETEAKSRELEKEMLDKYREKLLNSVKTKKAKNIILELYRPGATIGDGGTADALIDEAINGINPDNKGHYQKATDRVKEIEKSINKNLVQGDEDVLLKEKEKLEKAIELWEQKNGKK